LAFALVGACQQRQANVERIIGSVGADAGDGFLHSPGDAGDANGGKLSDAKSGTSSDGGLCHGVNLQTDPDN